eukprot:2988292-Rhodomonas_salina.2
MTHVRALGTVLVPQVRVCGTTIFVAHVGVRGTDRGWPTSGSAAHVASTARSALRTARSTPLPAYAHATRCTVLTQRRAILACAMLSTDAACGGTGLVLWRCEPTRCVVLTQRVWYQDCDNCVLDMDHHCPVQPAA